MIKISGAVDKEEFGDGPWDDEPDILLWEYKGVLCLITRHETCGFLRGYCGSNKEPTGVSVHGGVTFRDNERPSLPISGLTKELDDRFTGKYKYWVGFDCAHMSMDLLPRHNVSFSCGEGEYRDVEYVRQQTESMVDQIWKKSNS